MLVIADVLLILGTVAVAVYCQILTRRLRRFSELESGMGGAIAVLSAQVDDLTRTLEVARATAGGSAARLEQQADRAEAAAARLDLLLATLHDLPVADEPSGEMRKARFVRRRIGRSTLEAAE